MAKHMKSFSVHGLVKAEIVTTKIGSVPAIDFPYSYFESSDGSHPDIVLEIGDFHPENESMILVNHKFRVGEDYLHARESSKSARWEYDISGFVHPPIRIRVKSSIRGVESRLFPNYLAQNAVLKPILDFVLLRKGYLLIHGLAAASKDGAFILASRGGCHKTEIARMILTSDGDLRVMGDDWVIVSREGEVFSFPVLYETLVFKAFHGKSEHVSGPLEKVRLIRYLSRLRDNRSDLRSRFLDKAPLRDFLIGMPIETGISPMIATTDAESASRTISHGNMMEMIEGGVSAKLSKVNFLESMTAFSYVNPSSELASHWGRLETEIRELLIAHAPHKLMVPKQIDMIGIQNLIRMFKDRLR